MIKDTDKWISVGEYAKKYGLTRGKIYMDFYFGRLKDRAKKVKVEKEVLLVLDLPPIKPAKNLSPVE